MLITTAEDSYNIFRPNLEPEEDDYVVPEVTDPNEESKGSDTTQVSSHQPKNHNVYIDSDDEEAEEERYVKVAKKLNKQRSDAKDKKSKDGKRRKVE